MTRLRRSAIQFTAIVALTSLAGRAEADELTNLLASYAVLGAPTVTNTGPTTIAGNIGVSPGTTVTDQVQITLTGAYDLNNANAIQAQFDLASAIADLGTRPAVSDLSGQDLGNQVLTAGVYNFTSTAQLTGTLTLDAQGNPNAIFIIQVGSALTTASNSSVVLIHGAIGSNVYFVVGSSATLGTGTAFAGRILAEAAITLNTGATIDCGAVYAHTAQVSLDTNVISTVCAITSDTFKMVLGPTYTANEAAIAAALDAYVAGGGVLPTAFLPLLSDLSPEQLAAALAQLSGEAGTAVAPAATGAMDSFMSQLFDSAFGEDNTRSPPDHGPSTVRALGYASDDPRSPGPAAALAPMDPSLQPNHWAVWAAGYGGYSTTSGDAGTGSHDRSATTYGLSAGFEQRISAATAIGVALGAGHTSFGLADDFGGGKDDMLQAALYARTTLGRAYLTGALGYSYNNVSTQRDITVPTAEHFSANFAANDVAGGLEAGYRMGWFVPYAAARAQAFFTPGYDETADPGPSPFALHYNAQTSTALRTELGFRIERTIAMAASASLSLRARVAWAHDYGSAPYVTAVFQSIPDAPFTVQGAAAARDSLLLSAGAELGFGNGFAVGGLFDSQLAADSQNYSGIGRVSYRW